MDPLIWMAAAAGVAVALPAGWVVGRLRRPRPAPAPVTLPPSTRGDDGSARIASLESRLAREATAARNMQTHFERSLAAQAAEIEQLKQHLVQAYDELDRMRRPADTAHNGFAPTQPLRDL